MRFGLSRIVKTKNKVTKGGVQNEKGLNLGSLIFGDRDKEEAKRRKPEIHGLMKEKERGITRRRFDYRDEEDD